jgi:ATP-dependent DNA helicase RecQ
VNFDLIRARKLLRQGTGLPKVDFRDGQEEAIRHVVEGRGRLLVVQRTGWGKSFVYFIATKLLRESGFGPALLISPLLALMRNQIRAAELMGVRAATINSDNRDEWSEIVSRVLNDEIDILLISPERLGNEDFRTELLGEIGGTISLFVVDEAHCISDWGHDFRPHYRLVERVLRTLPPNIRVLATTATANERVIEDLDLVLGPDLKISRGGLARPSLILQTINLSSKAERLAWLAEQIPKIPGSGIVYVLTIRDAEIVTQWLSSNGMNVECYTGQTGDTRASLEDALIENRVKALIATTALGMGFDKPDLAFVIHYQLPGSVVAYYQQVGRAGRSLDLAYGTLLSGTGDSDIVDYFITAAFPRKDEVRQVIDALEAAPNGLSTYELQGTLNLKGGRINNTLQLLSIESPSPIAKNGSKWQLTSSDLSEEFWDRAERLTSLRRDEQRQMQDYLNLDSGHMEFLIRTLDGDSSGLEVEYRPGLPTYVNPMLVQDAIAFLGRESIPLNPRKQWRWPRVRNISPELIAEEGRVLSFLGDAGWGSIVQDERYKDGSFSDDLVDACVNLYSEWASEPKPDWVTAIPSNRNSDLMTSFAGRLARKLGLPYVDVLSIMNDRPEQKMMQNSVQQARNVQDKFTILVPVPKAPVLLVDDLVRSGWTMTVVASLLRSNGAGRVFPLALAYEGNW